MGALQQLLAGEGGFNPVYATWAPASAGGGMTLSGGNLTANNSGGAGAVAGSIGKSAGKWYWEITVGSGLAMLGVCNASENTTLLSYVGQTLNSWGFYAGSGQVYNNATPGAYATAYTTGDVLGFALDATNNQFQIYKNNANQGIIGVNSGPYYPACGINAVAVQGTANFGASPFVYSPPSGYNAGLYN